MTHVDPSIPQHLAELYQELNASRANLLELIKAEGSGIHHRTMDQLDRMIAEIFFPLEFVIYSEEIAVNSNDPATVTPAGHAWKVIGREGDNRTLLCEETGHEITISIERAIRDFALVPARLPEAYVPELSLTLAQLEEKYVLRGKNHPFLNHYQWLQAVRNDQTQMGYWQWVQTQLIGLRLNTHPKCPSIPSRASGIE